MNSKSLLSIKTESLGLTAWIACLILPLTMGSVVTGCLSRTALVRETYALHATPLTNSLTAKNPALVTIRTLEVSPLFESRSFVYRTGPDRYQLDPYAGFLITPARTLAIAMSSYLGHSAPSKNAVESGNPPRENTLLEAYVTELYGDFRPSGQPAAVLSIGMRFFDAGSAKTHQPFLEKNYVRRVPLHQKTTAALVAGWNQALAQTMAEVTSDLASTQAQAAGGTP